MTSPNCWAKVHAVLVVQVQAYKHLPFATSLEERYQEGIGYALSGIRHVVGK